MHAIKIRVTKHQYAKYNKLNYMHLKIFSKSTSQIVLYAGHLKKNNERSHQFCRYSFCKLVSQTNNDQTSPYTDY